MTRPVPARPSGGWRGLDRRQRGVLGCTIAANAVVFFDQTAVTVALPSIGRDLGGDALVLPWVVTSYLAALAMFMVVAGRVADRFGRRRTFLAGLALFAAGSVLCASAPSIGLLVAARFVQGVGGAIVAPLALSNTTRAVADAQRGWAIGMFAAGGTALLVFGPLLAGLLLEVASWRWVFLVTLPVLLAAWIVGRRCITPSRGAADAPGTSWATLRDPLLLASLAALFAIEFAVFGATVPLTLYLQHGLEQSAVTAGVLIALAGIGTPLLSVTAGRVSDRRGPRTLVVGGLVLAAAGLALLALLAPIGGVAPLIPGLAAFALARPAVFTPAGTGPFLALGDGQRAFAASLGTEARQCGAVLGAAVAGAVFAEVNGPALVDGDVTQVAGFVASVVVAAVVCAAAGAAAWRWLPRTSTPS